MICGEGMIYYVDSKAGNGGDGSRKRPFFKIQQAADIAAPGDEVIVLPGIYREEVSPANSGRPDARITYRSLEKHGAVITGAEPLSEWKKEGNVWRAEVPNRLFTDRNPYKERVSGDWLSAGTLAHLGEVFLNGRSTYEAHSKEEVESPVISDVSWDPAQSLYVWFTEQDEKRDMTVFYVNFGKLDPNVENVEFSVRKSCFCPEKTGVGYITLSGFSVCKAACQWAPPTAYQEGMIAPHWSKGWIIEDCDISEAKCVGVSLGKYLQKENDNKWQKSKYKNGTQTERECIMLALYEGWTKENIGGHVVRRCDIHDCGQAGIAGHLGGVFSLIEDNHIHRINNKHDINGAETGGIKLHAAIDVIVRRNRIHDCTRGLWLDWQAQGTRVTQNLFYNNNLPHRYLMNKKAADVGVGEDVFIEVSHGPTLVDHNLLLSSRSMRLATQGAAIVHNLIAGSFVSIGIGTDNCAETLPNPRYTPYHFPHRTEVAGFMTFLHGDMRFVNNIFVQKDVHPYLLEREKESADNIWDDGNMKVGLKKYNGYPDRAEWEKQFEGYCGMGAKNGDRYYSHLPVSSYGNVYFNGAEPWEKERDSIVDTEHRVTLEIVEKDGGTVLSTDLDSYLPDDLCRLVDTEALGEAFEPEQRFEDPDGNDIVFDVDYFGERKKTVFPGAFADGRYDGREV